jgi:hypothetical protein
MPALMEASTYITVHYRNGTHAFIVAWTSSNLGHAPFGMKRIFASHIQNAERPRMAKRGETQTRQWVPFGLGPIHPSHDFHAVPPHIAKRDELVWLCRK